MDIVSQLGSYFHYIALFAFFITLILLIVEFRIILKSRKNIAAPLPHLDPTVAVAAHATPVSDEEIHEVEVEQSHKMRKHKILLPLLIVLMIIFGALTIIGFFFSDTPPDDNAVVVQEVKSSGVKLYTSDWEEIVGDSAPDLEEGDSVYVGVGTVTGSDITKARIKVNEAEWKVEHTTAQYDQNLEIFYSAHTIKTGDTAIDVEAQLYSNAEGWLDE